MVIPPVGTSLILVTAVVVAGGGVLQNQGWVWQSKKVGEEDDQIMALLKGAGDGLCGQRDECGVGALGQGD